MVETFFTEKRIIKKLIIAIIFVFMFNFTYCYLGNNIVFAADEIKEGDDLSEYMVAEEGGGRLFLPVQKLFLFICDSIMNEFQENFVLGSGDAIIKAYSGELKSTAGAGEIFWGCLITIGCVVLYFLPGFISDAAASVGATSFWASLGIKAAVGTLNFLHSFAGAGAIAGTVITIVGVNTFTENIKGEYDLPNIWYTPSVIFGNKVPLFNINFFDPFGDSYSTISKEEAIMRVIKNNTNYVSGGIEISDKSLEGLGFVESISKFTYEIGPYESDDNYYSKYTDTNTIWYNALDGRFYKYIDRELYHPGGPNTASTGKSTHIMDITQCIELIPQKEIDAEMEKEKETILSASRILQQPVSTIYKSLRIVAIISMLTILVYVGIRIVLSSAAKEKAKYKQMIVDWLVAFIMLFVLHYIMAFTIKISEILTNICDEANIEVIYLQGIPLDTKILVFNEETDEEVYYTLPFEEGKEGMWATNVVGQSRFFAGLVSKKGFTAKGIAYTLMYMVFVIYTCIFTFQYLKRAFWMAFLTMIAPLVSITYPLDKIRDGKAQGFNFWLREYIFNALLQPIHYIVYVVIMGSVMQLVAEHPVYALVALGFMVPAENFIRKMFGFDKAGTVSAFGGAAGAAMLMGGIQKLSPKGHGGGSSGGGTKEKDSKPSSKIRSIDSLPEGPEGMVTAKNINNIGESNSIPIDGTSSETGGSSSTSSGGSSNSSTLNNGRSDMSFSSSALGDNEQLNKPTNSILNGFKTLGGHYTRRIGKGLEDLPSASAKALRRGITYGLGATALGAVGLAAGIASGDPSKAFQYTVAGGAVGGKIGKSIGDKASDLIGAESAMTAFEAGYYGENYSNIQASKYNKDFKSNVSNYETAIKNVGRDGWTEMLADKGIIDEALDYGINDMTTMCNVYKTKKELKRKHSGWSDEKAQEQAFKAHELTKKFGDISNNYKTQENLTKILRLKRYSEDEIEEVEKELKDLIKTYKNISKD